MLPARLSSVGHNVHQDAETSRAVLVRGAPLKFNERATTSGFTTASITHGADCHHTEPRYADDTNPFLLLPLWLRVPRRLLRSHATLQQEHRLPGRRLPHPQPDGRRQPSAVPRWHLRSMVRRQNLGSLTSTPQPRASPARGASRTRPRTRVRTRHLMSTR